MIVGVNARTLLSGKLDGIGWYAYETIKRLTVSHPDVSFVLFFDRPVHADFTFGPNVRTVVFGPPARHPFLWYLWFELRLPAALRAHHCDVFYSPEGLVPSHPPVPMVSVLHDMGYEAVPEQVDPLVLRYYRRFFPRGARAAARLVTVSDFARADIAIRTGIPTTSITVAPNAPRPIFRDPVHATPPPSYLLFVGTIQPRKNVVRLLKAFDVMKTKTGSAVQLVVAGRRGWKDADVDAALAGMTHAGDVRFTGYVTDEELVALYKGARAVVQVPLFEGFGVPVIEAMAVGTPVIASNVSSLPEVAGSAALLVDPLDVPAIAHAMERVITDDELCDELRAKGIRQAATYSWDHTAEILWQCITDVVRAARYTT
jgi:glycosyltransferase involved in cell wall biosynthesis